MRSGRNISSAVWLQKEVILKVTTENCNSFSIKFFKNQSHYLIYRHRMFQNRPWIFQQDSAPAHKAKTTQQWLKNHVYKFISSDYWLSASPNLNLLNYKLWPVLVVCTRRHHNQESLKQAKVEAMDNLPMDVIHIVIDEWPNRLWCCIRANGCHFK